MSKLIEAINSLSDGNVEEVKEALIAEANALNKANSDLYKRAKKAEGFEYDRSKKEWTKKEKPEPKETKPEPKATDSDEPDYNQLTLKTYLKSEGITLPEAQEFVLKESKRLKLPVDQLLQEAYVQSKVKDIADQHEAESGHPKGGGSGKSGSGQNDVNHWVDKKNPDGTYATPSDPELHAKVIDARMKASGDNKMFDDSLD